MDDFVGKVAVVTGAASGLGCGISSRLVELGASVVLADVEEGPLAEVANRLGQRAVAVHTDVSDEASIEELGRRATDAFGAVDILFNNAGVTPPPTTIADTTPEMWEWTLGVNLRGVVNGLRTFLPPMIERRTGYIVNTASLLGITSGRSLAIYAASKAGVIALSLSLREELDGSGVGVSVAFPHVASNIHKSRRNWPARLGEDPWLVPDRDERSVQIEELTSKYVAAGLTPVEAADVILDGVRAASFWIIATHDPDVARAAFSPMWPEVS